MNPFQKSLYNGSTGKLSTSRKRETVDGWVYTTKVKNPGPWFDGSPQSFIDCSAEGADLTATPPKSMAGADKLSGTDSRTGATGSDAIEAAAYVTGFVPVKRKRKGSETPTEEPTPAN